VRQFGNRWRPAVIVDHVDNLELADEEAKKYFNELHSLVS
jgi:hypothetical protein